MAEVPESESPPAAAISFKCITKEAELMCQCLVCGASFAMFFFAVSNVIRHYALSLMTYKDYVPAAAAMMGIIKEAELSCELMRGDQRNSYGELGWIDIVRDRTLRIMMSMCDEYSAVADPTVEDITGDLNFNESDNKLAENGCHEERANLLNENKNSKKELARNDMEERNRTGENKNPNEKLGRNSLEEDKVKPDTKDGTEKQVDLAGSNNDVYSFHSKKLKDVLKDQTSPLGGKAGGHKKRMSGCFNLVKPGGSANGTAS